MANELISKCHLRNQSIADKKKWHLFVFLVSKPKRKRYKIVQNGNSSAFVYRN